MAAVETLMVSMGIPPMYMDQQEHDRNLAVLHKELDELTLKKFWEKGKGLSLDQAIAFALEEN